MKIANQRLIGQVLMYDLNILPIHLKQGRQSPDTGGLHAFSPPRRAARGRDEDILILSFSFTPADVITEELKQTWHNHLANIFFKTSGTVTAALRSLIETLNLTIMELNIKTAQDGIAVTGAVNLAVVHRHSIYIAQSGQTHAFVLNHQGLQHHTDTSQTDRGLGVSRTATIRYYQDDLGTGAYFFTTDSPPTSWRDTLLFSDHFPSMDQLRRRLLNQAPSDFSVGLVQLLPGEGRINLIRPVDRSAGSGSTTAQESQSGISPEGREPETNQIEQENIIKPKPQSEERIVKENSDHTKEIKPSQPREPVVPEEALEQQQNQQKSPVEKKSQTKGPQRTPMSHLRSVPEPDSAYTKERVRPDREVGTAAREKLNVQKAQIEERGLKGLAAALTWWRNTRQRVDTFFKDLIARLKPGETGETPKLSKGTLVFIAVAVPLIVVAITVGVYLARGRAQQYTYYYNQAQIYAQAAAATDDPSAARDNWAQALIFVTEAETFRSTDESVILKEKVQDALDLLDGAIRLDYRPALIGTLYSEINITRIVSYGADLYLLDEAGGRVIHASRRSQGYEVDPDFVCAAGIFEGGAVGDLVDMVSLPINNPYQAHVAGIDVAGNLAYCASGMDPIVIPLPSPVGNTGEIMAIAYNSGYLYALNPSANTIRVYLSTNGQFLDTPTEFFDGANMADIPDLNQITDLAANGPELYLLRSDGLTVDCTTSGLADDPVKCENPVSYVDGRIGLEDQPVSMPAANYTSVLYTSPPDPSVNILDASSGDIYRFSQRFRLYQRLRPSFGEYEVENPVATAFTIGIDRVAFLAFGNQVFFAYVD
jgi:hypothetical protein